MNPILMLKEDRERMCLKSKQVFGVKWKWRKLCKKHQFSWQDLETRLDTVLNQRKEAYERSKQSNKQLGTNPGSGSKSSGGRGEITSGSGEEVRSGKTDD